ncbi:hypothetical protein SETIT_3G072500v2 [Setaria italica]|uniref:Uncharacterized protein n=1 Tax=Setaria italica TaxID=4555 RepID=A0A368QED8_SETIT|nr:hypothetical protein SETIT_3G072500v2 [Setaria italica]
MMLASIFQYVDFNPGIMLIFLAFVGSYGTLRWSGKTSWLILCKIWGNMEARE